MGGDSGWEGGAEGLRGVWGLIEGVWGGIWGSHGTALAPTPPPRLPLERVRLRPPVLSPSPDVELETEAVRERDRRVMADEGTVGQGAGSGLGHAPFAPSHAPFP